MQSDLLLEMGTASYVPAQLTSDSSRGWFIYYYIFNPVVGALEAKYVKLNRVKKQFRTISDFKAYANNIVQTINAKLAQGWSPYGEREDARHYETIETLCEKYIEEKTRDKCAESTIRSYKTFNNALLAWCEKNAAGVKCIMFSRSMAIRFMDYMYNDHTFVKPKKNDEGRSIRKPRTARQRAALPDDERTEEKHISANCYNNYVKQGRLLFGWAVEKCYCKENPFEFIKLKDKEHKIRTVANADHRKVVRDYYMEHNPNFLVVAELVFSSLIRPVEISRIRVGQVHLAQKVIRLNEDQTKNGYSRDAVLSDELIKILADMLAPGYPEDYYLIGPGWKPGETAMSSKSYRKSWQAMREKTGLPESIQLYSLRDTGIKSLFDNGADANTVKGAADHHDLNITTRYLDHVDTELVDKVRKHQAKF